MMFGTILTSGMQMIANCGFTQRNITIVAMALSIGIGFTTTSESGIWAEFSPVVQSVFSVCQIYAVRYAGGDLLQLADPVLRTGHELSEKGEPRETDRHARDLGTADSDAALYAAVSGSGLLFLDLP